MKNATKMSLATTAMTAGGAAAVWNGLKFVDSVMVATPKGKMDLTEVWLIAAAVSAAIAYAGYKSVKGVVGRNPNGPG